MLDVFNYFSDNKTNGYKIGQFRTDWKELTAQDKEDLKTGITNGTFDY